jgi:predicted RNA-binding Zn-ribbon protein involved in translation (DUF1610 family)
MSLHIITHTEPKFSEEMKPADLCPLCGSEVITNSIRCKRKRKPRKSQVCKDRCGWSNIIPIWEEVAVQLGYNDI